jgi:hypothetical protein
MSRLSASAEAIEFSKTELYSSLDVTTIKYDMYTHSRDEKVKVAL